MKKTKILILIISLILISSILYSYFPFNKYTNKYAKDDIVKNKKLIHNTKEQFDLGIYNNTETNSQGIISLRDNYIGEYISPPINLENFKNAYKLEMTSYIPSQNNASIEIKLRSADNIKGLINAQWYEIDDYYANTKELIINPIHKNDNYIQYKIIFKTDDVSYSPLLYDVIINYGSSIPEIRSVVLSSPYRGISYTFDQGDRIYIAIEVVEYTGIDNILTVKADIYNNSDLYDTIQLTPGDIIDSIRRYYTGSFVTSSKSGMEINLSVNNNFNTYKESVFIKVRDDYKEPPQSMKLGVLKEYGFWNYKNSDMVIKAYKEYAEIDIWKLGIAWSLLEPKRGEFNEIYINSILQFMDAALENGAKVQISMAQQWWPDWVNNNKLDDGNRYNSYIINRYLSDTWTALSDRIKDHPALEAYLIINEENYVKDATSYIISNNKVISKIRSNDRNYSHRITIRPVTGNGYVRTVIVQNGNQDYEYETSSYPTSSDWQWKRYASPLSYTSFLKMASIRNSPIANNGKGGIGEIGFFKGYQDKFGDEEKLIAFKRALSIAYDQGFDEFMIWGAGFAFESPDIYFPKLKEFRDYLVTKPRLTRFDVRILSDNGDMLVLGELTEKKPEIDILREPYYNLVRTLDERGYSWYFVYPSYAETLQRPIYDITINLSYIKGKDMKEQDDLILKKLKDIKPTGTVYPWDIKDHYLYSINNVSDLNKGTI